jgi:hypothetical protein
MQFVSGVRRELELQARELGSCGRRRFIYHKVGRRHYGQPSALQYICFPPSQKIARPLHAVHIFSSFLHAPLDRN